MDNIKIFKNPQFGEIRTTTQDGEPWFSGKDVALALGYSNPHKAVRDHVDDEDKGMNETFTPGGRADSGICTASIKTKGSQLLAQSRLSGLTENRT